MVSEREEGVVATGAGEMWVYLHPPISRHKDLTTQCCARNTTLSTVFEGRKEGNVLFNDARNTLYLRLYGVG